MNLLIKNFPKPLRDAIRAEADKEGYTIKGLIIRVLRKYFKVT